MDFKNDFQLELFITISESNLAPVPDNDILNHVAEGFT